MLLPDLVADQVVAANTGQLVRLVHLGKGLRGDLVLATHMLAVAEVVLLELELTVLLVVK